MKKYKLKDVAEIYNGATPLTNNKTFYEGGNISWITPKDLSGYNHKYIYSGKRNITEKGLLSCATNILPKGTVLFSSRAPIGYVAIAGRELCTNQGFKSFVCNSKVLDNQYLYYYLIKNKGILEALGNGSTFKEISLKTIAEYQIELPSIDTQKALVKDLIELDKRYDNNCSILLQLEELMERIYYDYIESNAIQDENVGLGSVVDIISGGTPSTKTENYWNNGIYYWYTPSDITANNNMITYKSTKKISISGLANSSAKLIPAHSVLMTPKNEHMCALQLLFWVKQNKRKIASIANGSTFKEVYKKDLEKLPINLNKVNSKRFNEKTDGLFNLFKSLFKENLTILELKKNIIDIRFR